MNNPKHKNQVRITGGLLRGRKLGFADAEGLRPTPDSVRERLFNWLGQDLTGLNVLDLFAGSGALALDALSRHAVQAVLVEQNRGTARHLSGLLREWGLADRARVWNGDAVAYLQQVQTVFDVVFLDPPFAWQQWPQLLASLPAVLKEGAWVYLEAGSLPALPPYLQEVKSGKAGSSRYLLLRYVSDGNLI